MSGPRDKETLHFVAAARATLAMQGQLTVSDVQELLLDAIASDPKDRLSSLPRPVLRKACENNGALAGIIATLRANGVEVTP